MLYKTLERMISRHQTEGLAERIDIFFAVGSLTAEEYQKLKAMLGPTESK